MELNHAHCYDALRSRDARFDGEFYVGVSTTGIYCRPVCRVRLPGRDRCSFFASPAAAEAQGFRPCMRCRPELAPGTAPADSAAGLCDRAVARIEAGALTGASLEELAAELGVSSRQLRRVIQHAYGVSPVQLAQTRSLLLAKQLLTDTRLPIHEVAAVSGFTSTRRLNHLFRTRYRMRPTDLRKNAVSVLPDTPTSLVLKLGYRPPLDWKSLIHFLVDHGSSAAEQVNENRYLRTVRIGPWTGWISATADIHAPTVNVEVSPSLVPALPLLRPRLRRLFDLDANPLVIAAHLAQCDLLSSHVTATPGLRVPGALDGFELAMRTVIGQQISVRAATTVFSRILNSFGEPIETPFPGLDRLPPLAHDIAVAPPQRLISCGLTGKRVATIQALAAAVTAQQANAFPGDDSLVSLDLLKTIPGIGPWTLQYTAMRALANPDAFPGSDLALMKAAGCARATELESAAEPWRPWRAYAAMHLWKSYSSKG